MYKYSHHIKLKPPDLHSAWSSLQSPYKMQYPNIGKYKEILKSEFNPNTYLLLQARDYHQKQLNKIKYFLYKTVIFNQRRKVFYKKKINHGELYYFQEMLRIFFN